VLIEGRLVRVSDTPQLVWRHKRGRKRKTRLSRKGGRADAQPADSVPMASIVASAPVPPALAVGSECVSTVTPSGFRSVTPPTTSAGSSRPACAAAEATPTTCRALPGEEAAPRADATAAAAVEAEAAAHVDRVESSAAEALSAAESLDIPKDSGRRAAASTAAAAEDVDPLRALRHAALEKGLVLEVHSGRNLPERLRAEAIDLARRNVSAMSGWDARQRDADLSHSQSRILLLRRPDQTSVGDGASPQPPPPRRSRSRELAALGGGAGAGTASSGAASGVDQPLAGPTSVVGFASYRFVTQETLRILYVFELHLEGHMRRQGLGSHLLNAARASGELGQRQGMLLTVHLANQTARSFYAARGLTVSPISPSRCAPPSLAADVTYDVMQDIWDLEGAATMRARGAAARRALFSAAGVSLGPPDVALEESRDEMSAAAVCTRSENTADARGDPSAEAGVVDSTAVSTPAAAAPPHAEGATSGPMRKRQGVSSSTGGERAVVRPRRERAMAGVCRFVAGAAPPPRVAHLAARLARQGTAQKE
jgi:ribosomal protein S18 acetylase RimI-like enzyme